MTEYRNPVIPGFYPDPSICRVGEDYYLVTSSMEYFPGIPLFHSRDLLRWEQLGHCLTRPSQLPLEGVECSGGIWAPTIRWHEGVFYVTSTNVSIGGNFIVTAADPAGEWSEPVRVDMGGIDPSLTFDGGKAFYTTNQAAADGTPGISMAEIDAATGKLLSPIRFLWQGTGGRAAEAPHLYRIGDRYYLMIAEGGTQFTHMETIARARSPWGPFEACPRNPILTNTTTKKWEVHCTGHGDLVQDHRGHWWMAHLGIRIARKYMSHLGRETFLAPVTWDDEGWPVVNYGECVDVVSRGPLPPSRPLPPEPARDDFGGERLAPCWITLRGPAAESCRLGGEAGGLTLFGNRHDLDALASPAFVARRQRYFRCRMETQMTFAPTRENEEAGLALLATNEFHYKLCVRLVAGRPCLLLEKRAEDFRETAACLPVPEGPLTLRVEAERERYAFSFSAGDGVFHPVGTASTRFLACEVVGRGFTGVVAGMYATGRGEDCRSPARFDYFLLEEIKEV